MKLEDKEVTSVHIEQEVREYCKPDKNVALGTGELVTTSDREHDVGHQEANFDDVHEDDRCHELDFAIEECPGDSRLPFRVLQRRLFLFHFLLFPSV